VFAFVDMNRQTWLNTPDNRKGMASLFLDEGYLVYIVDAIAVGRSTSNNIAQYPLKFGSTVLITEEGFTHPEGDADFAPFYPQATLHTQWPGTGLAGDAVFDVFEASFLPLTSNNTHSENTMRAAGCQLLSLIGKSFLVSHSAGAIQPILISDECPEFVAGNVNLESATIPFQSPGGTADNLSFTPARPFGLTYTNLHYSPPITFASELILETTGVDSAGNRSCVQQSTAGSVIHTLPNLAMVPYVMFTGQGSVHVTWDGCVIQYLNQVGVKTEWIHMEDVGVFGNGHFGFMELNSVAFFTVVESWIAKQAAVTPL
jgi:hypothetical protein